MEGQRKINLTYTEPFEFDVASGAGILTYCVGLDGTMYFLLGKERSVAQWKGSLKWSAFEGGRKKNESPEETAAREFSEETLGIVPFGASGDAKLWSAAAVLSALEREEYHMKIVIKMKNKVDERFHVTFVKCIPWIPHIMEKFAMMRSLITRVNEVAERLRFMKNALPFCYPFLRENMVIEYKKKTLLITAILDVALRKGVLEVEFEYQEERTAVDRFRSKFKSAIADHQHVTTYCEWFKYRRAATKFLESIAEDSMDHPAITSVYNNYGLLMSLDVNHDYLEKQEIRMWSVEELYATLRSGGSYSSEHFRPYFMPLVQILLEANRKNLL